MVRALSLLSVPARRRLTQNVWGAGLWDSQTVLLELVCWKFALLIRE